MQNTAFAASSFALLVVMGCNQPAQLGTDSLQPTADSWTTYTSPNGRVQFDHPSSMKIIVRPRKDDRDPHFALSATNPDESIQLTLMLRVAEEPQVDYCKQMINYNLNENSRAISERQNIAMGNGRGFRQEFHEQTPGEAQVEYIAVALEAKPIYLHFTCGCFATRKSELWPVCEKITKSLILKK